MPGGCLGALGGDLGKKNGQEAVLAEFGRFWTGSDRPKSRPNGARWRQLGPKIEEKTEQKQHEKSSNFSSPFGSEISWKINRNPSENGFQN